MEGLPDELGPEWRILHPFEIPGVRNPTEDTPPNHRRLAENNTLVELIQTAEYLEDAPSWEQRRFYPLHDMVILITEDCGRGHGRGRGRGRGWLSEDVTERDTGGRGRFHFRGNGREQYVQYRNGSVLTHDERRRDIHLEMPPEPEPSRFSDWSSVGSPPIRTSPPSAPDLQTEQQDGPQNQLNVPPAETTRSERIDVGNPEIVTIASQTEPMREGQDIPIRPAAENIETRNQRNDLESREGENIHDIPPIQIRSARSSLHMDDVILTRSAPRESSARDDSHIRIQDVNIEGISSICRVRRSVTHGIRQDVLDERGCGLSYQHEGIHPPRMSAANRRESSNSSDNNRFHRERGHVSERGRPPERERDTQIETEDLP